MGLPVEVNSLMIGSLGGYNINRSLRFRNSATAYLNRTPASAGNRRTWTFSFWAKLANLGTGNRVLSTYTASTDQDRLLIGDTILFATSVGGVQYTVGSNNVYRDPSSWYHFMVSVDTTQSTSNNRMRLYTNGVEVSYSTQTMPPQNTQLNINNTIAHWISGYNGTSELFGGYLAEVNFVDGSQLTPSSFGAYDTNGVWQPKKYSGTYGTNGFYLPFSNTTSTTTLVQDSSGNGNNWTPNNISLTAGTTYDSMIDSPTNAAGGSTGIGNYAVLNPLDKNSAVSTARGNLQSIGSGANNQAIRSSVFMNSGKWYFEGYLTSINPYASIGIISSVDNISSNIAVGTSANGYAYWEAGSKGNNASGTAYGSSYTAGDLIGVAYDADSGKIWFAKNGTWQASGDPAAGTNAAFTGLSGSFAFAVGMYNNTTWDVNFGQRPFSYTPPSGFKALNTYNLPAPSIANGAQYFAATTYTGTGSSLAINNGNNTTISTTFQPDLVWIKSRSNAYNHELYDSVRGPTLRIISNLTNAETTSTLALTSFNSNGFTQGGQTETGANGATYAAWQWKAGGTGVTNTSGSITSTVSANTTAGFSVVTYTGNEVQGATVGHGLGVAPSMVIIKDRTSAQNWAVWHTSLSSGYFVYLNSTAAQSNAAPLFNGSNPSSTVITLAGGAQTDRYTVNKLNDTYVAYCFAAVSGYSAFGKYTGNGSADGPFIYTGFRPRFILVKDSSAIQNWRLFDSSRSTYNAVLEGLFPNLSNAESSAETGPDFLSNGFKIRTSSNTHNASGNTIIYAAFAEVPYNFARAR